MTKRELADAVGVRRQTLYTYRKMDGWPKPARGESDADYAGRVREWMSANGLPDRRSTPRAAAGAGAGAGGNDGPEQGEFDFTPRSLREKKTEAEIRRIEQATREGREKIRRELHEELRKEAEYLLGDLTRAVRGMGFDSEQSRKWNEAVKGCRERLQSLRESERSTV